MEGGHYFGNYGVPGVGTLLKNNLQMLLKGELTVEEYQAKLTDEINSKIAEMGE